MSENIKIFINFFKQNSILEIKEIEWLLLKYSDSYREINNYCKCNSESDGLPCICERSKDENIFLSIFNSLDELTEYHRLEKFANEQLLELKKICENKEKIKIWLIKNEKIASQDLACFLIDYLDYSEIEEDNINLLAYRDVNHKIEILVNRQDFENLIEYKELFDKLYYIKKLYPEGLKKIDEEIKTTANTV